MPQAGGKGSTAGCRVSPQGDNRATAVWTVPAFLPYRVPGPLDVRRPEVVCKAGVDNPAYYDSEAQPGTKDSNSDPLSTPIKLKKQPWLRFWELRFQSKDSKHHYRRTMALMIVLIVVLLVLVVTVGLVVYLTVGGGVKVWEKEEEEIQELEGSMTVEGNFRIINRAYSNDLTDHRSPGFIRLSAQVLQSLDEVFLQSSLVRDYNTSEIVGFRPGSVIVECRIFLNRPLINIVQKVGMTFVRALEQGHGTLPAGSLHVDIQSIRFTGIRGIHSPSSPAVIVTTPSPNAAWSQWGEWTSCLSLGGICNPYKVQSRSRECKDNHGKGKIFTSFVPCQKNGEREIEVKDCICPPSPVRTTSVPSTTTTTSIIGSTTKTPNAISSVSGAISSTSGPEMKEKRSCDECYEGELCLLYIGASTAHCVSIKDPDDPRGCGGWCSAEHELCRNLNNNTFQCIDDTECLPDEWRCGNGLCIPTQRRCDGHFNCYDMTDEYGCECSSGEFQCGNKTSCLPNSLLCNGHIDCWDGSDEGNCTVLCPESQYTCNNGQCITKDYFCDGYSDCEDRSDEPVGCDAPCLSSQKKCNNGRCISNTLWCDGKDHCGDNSDEKACSASISSSVPRSSVIVSDDSALTDTENSHSQSQNKPHTRKQS